VSVFEKIEERLRRAKMFSLERDAFGNPTRVAVEQPCESYTVCSICHCNVEFVDPSGLCVDCFNKIEYGE
jgi:hypothetical protein